MIESSLFLNSLPEMFHKLFFFASWLVKNRIVVKAKSVIDLDASNFQWSNSTTLKS
jgi:hypothetical protein